MRDVKFSNEDIYSKYQKIMERKTLNESKKGYRRKVQLIDDRIDDLIDDIEKRIQKEEENPTYQRKLFQMLADMNKEHGEFLMSIKRIASTIDSGAKTIPQAKGEMQPNTMQGFDEPQAPAQPAAQQPNGQEQENNVNEEMNPKDYLTATKKTLDAWNAFSKVYYDQLDVIFRNKDGATASKKFIKHRDNIADTYAKMEHLLAQHYHMASRLK